MSRDNVEQGDRIALTGFRTARRHRTLDERIFIRFPALVRGLAYLGSRLPRGSRLRRWWLARAVCRGMAAANRRDFDLLFLGFDPAIDYRAVSERLGGGIVPDLVGHHHGHAGYRNMWRRMLEGFDDLTLEPEEVIDFGDCFICVIRLTGHGSGSGVPIDQPLFQACTLRRGLLIKQEDFFERAEAFESLGMPE